MGFLILLFIIFILSVAMILIFSPEDMSEEESYKTEVKHLWGLVKLCQTASFGFPSLDLKPAKRSVMMDLHFLDDDTLSLTLPLILKKQQKAKASYLELFSNYDVNIFDLGTKLTVHLDRKDEKLGELITHIYKEVFEAEDTDTVKFTVKTLRSDINAFRIFNVPRHQLREDFSFEDLTFKARSAKHKGKSLLSVLLYRISRAVYFLLYPPLIILAFKFWGLTAMCWTALFFFGFFAAYDSDYKKTSIANSLLTGNLLYCLLLSAALITRKVDYIQIIPSVIGASTAIISATLVLELKEPWSEKQISNKKNDPKEFKFGHSFWVLGGVGLFLASEWARRNLEIEAWVSFFAFIRIELMLAMIVVFTPAYILFLKRTGRF